MRRWYVVCAVALAVLPMVACAWADEPVEDLWRSRGGLRDTRVSRSDGSLWFAEGANLVHLSAGGERLFRSGPLLGFAYELAVDPGNASGWALEANLDNLLHFAADGTLLSITPGYDNWSDLEASPADGAVWVIERDGFAGPDTDPQVARVDSSGVEVWRSPWPSRLSIVADAADGSAWAVDKSSSEAVHVAPDGHELGRTPGVAAVYEVDPRDHSVWAEDEASQRLLHCASDGSVIWRQTTGQRCAYARVSPLDGAIWVTPYVPPPMSPPPTSLPPLSAQAGGMEYFVDHRAASGELLASYSHAAIYGFNDLDGSAWLCETGDPEHWLVQYSAEDTELRRFASPPKTVYLGYSPVDNTFWAAGYLSNSYPRPYTDIHRLGADGAVLWAESLDALYGGWVDPRDSSCWALNLPDLNCSEPELVHLAFDGSELGRSPLSDGLPYEHLRIEISPTDGSWWVKGSKGYHGLPDDSESVLLRLAPDGSEVWRRSLQGRREGYWTFAVDSADDSVWAMTTLQPEPPVEVPQGLIYHFAADGTQLWEGQVDSTSLSALAVDTADRSVVVAAQYIHPGALGSTQRIIRFSSTGEVLSQTEPPLYAIGAVAVRPSDGSIYGLGYSDSLDGPVVFRMSDAGEVLWAVSNIAEPEGMAFDAADGSVWVTNSGGYLEGYGTFADASVIHLAEDGTRLWRGRRFSVPEWIDLDPRSGTVWVSDVRNKQLIHLGVPSPFPDVPASSWAFDEISACVEAGIVYGFPEGDYKPGLPVTRGQMAVYIARGLAGGEAAMPTGPAEATFPDVPTDHWAYAYIEYAAANNVVQGYPEGDYKPDKSVTRDQMAVYIARAMVAPTTSVLADYVPSDPRNFPDALSDYWAYTYIEYCVEQGVVGGYSEGDYKPTVVVTRDQMAVYVARAFGLTE